MVGRGAVNRRAARALIAAVVASAPFACGPRTLPAYGEALIVVDTDLPVPRLASRLRVDVYTDDGRWIDTQDFTRREPSSWPVSFTVYAPKEGSSAARVRLRAYADGYVRDYRGSARIVAGGVDVTPRTEPLPGVAVDRLVRVPLAYGAPGRARIVLRGACAGAPADLEGDRTCVSVEGELANVVASELEPELVTPTTSLQGTFGVVPPPQGAPREGTVAGSLPLYDEEIAVQGGAFVFGGRELGNFTRLLDTDVASVPERLVVVPSLFVDRYEVTVGRWRAAVRDGFAPPTPATENDGPLPLSGLVGATEKEYCTYSSRPLPPPDRWREDIPITCVTRASARAFCQRYGGDLLTEAQWEYVATAAGRPGKTLYAWGDGVPRCDGVIWGRSDDTAVGDPTCFDQGAPFGPGSVNEGDETPARVHGMGGNVTEWVLDDFRPFTDPCWAVPRTDPRCADPTAPYGSARGGNWMSFGGSLHATNRMVVELSGYLDLGFRCARAPREGAHAP